MISALKLTSALVIKVRTGVDENGNSLYKSISLKKVKPAATGQYMFDVAQAIARLLKGTGRPLKVTYSPQRRTRSFCNNTYGLLL